MKKLLMLAVTLVFVGCQPAFTEDKAQGLTKVSFQDYSVGILVDNRTGCHYIVAGRGSSIGITPRLYSDGVQVCD